MKIIGIVGSPRKGGNTETMMQEALGAAREAGAVTEIVFLAEKKLAGCDGCEACRKLGTCKNKDDMQAIYQQIESADGIIIGTPVYFNGVSSQTKTFIDRTYSCLMNRTLKGKVAGAIVVARRIGAGHTLSSLYNYFMVQGMVIAAGGVGYGTGKAEVKEGVGGAPTLSALQEARAVGRNVVRLATQLAKGKIATSS